jgi:cytidylate kinase
MPGVTISAAFGLGGAGIAKAVSEQLELPLLDRAINADVAKALRVSLEEAATGSPHKSFTAKFFSILSPLSSGVLGEAAGATLLDFDDAAAFREQSEKVIRDAVATGAVVLGRGGSAALRDEPDVLRVRLFGPDAARLRQAMAMLELDEATARRQMQEIDSAREHYTKKLYKTDANDPALFHLQIDSTALPVEHCAALIVQAYRALTSTP